MTGIAHLRRPTAASIEQVASTQVLSGRRVGFGLLAFAAVWLSHLALTSLSPPVDTIEQLSWVRSLELGTAFPDMAWKAIKPTDPAPCTL